MLFIAVMIFTMIVIQYMLTPHGSNDQNNKHNHIKNRNSSFNMKHDKNTRKNFKGNHNNKNNYFI